MSLDRPSICQAEQYGDRMRCRICDQSWDTNDPDPPPCKPEDVPAILRMAAETYEDRNKVYRSMYKDAGAVLLYLFPDQRIPTMSTPEEVARFRMIVMCATKLQRYCQNFHTGGHRDSAHDLIVYAAMLEELTDECPF